MSLPSGIQAREHQKFVEDGSGNTAVRAILVGGTVQGDFTINGDLDLNGCQTITCTSTAAFLVETAAGVDFFNLDTTNGILSMPLQGADAGINAFVVDKVAKKAGVYTDDLSQSQAFFQVGLGETTQVPGQSMMMFGSGSAAMGIRDTVNNVEFFFGADSTGIICSATTAHKLQLRWNANKNYMTGLLSGAMAMTSISQGMEWYNTADMDTNYEKFSIDWVSNTIVLQTQAGGTGTQRNIKFAAPTTTFESDVVIDKGGLVNSVLEINGSTHHAIRSTASDELQIRDTTAGENRIVIKSNGNTEIVKDLITSAGRQLQINSTAITSNTTITSDQEHVVVDTSSASVTIYFPASPATGETHTVFHKTTGNTLIIDGNGNNLRDILGFAPFISSTVYIAKTFIFDGTDWLLKSSDR